jgi:hypothetical protein
MATATLNRSRNDEAMHMYDTETPAGDTVCRKQARSVHAWMRAAAYAAGSEPEDDFLAPAESDLAEVDLAAAEPELAEVDLGHAVECKKRDNLALGCALVSIGLIGQRELAEMESAQAESDDLVGSLMVASAIRSQLGEILLKAQRITSSQLEFALELQRHQGGRLGELLVSLGWLDRATLDAALAAQASRKAA